jgi:hypothetical protein
MLVEFLKNFKKPSRLPSLQIVGRGRGRVRHVATLTPIFIVHFIKFAGLIALFLLFWANDQRLRIGAIAEAIQKAVARSHVYAPAIDKRRSFAAYVALG